MIRVRFRVEGGAEPPEEWTDPRGTMPEIWGAIRARLREAVAAGRCGSVVVAVHLQGEHCDHEAAR